MHQDDEGLHRALTRWLLPQGLGRVSSTAHTPAVANAKIACIGVPLAVLGSYDPLSRHRRTAGP